jgi:hypothetical protein
MRELTFINIQGNHVRSYNILLLWNMALLLQRFLKNTKFWRFPMNKGVKSVKKSIDIQIIWLVRSFVMTQSQ